MRRRPGVERCWWLPGLLLAAAGTVTGARRADGMPLPPPAPLPAAGGRLTLAGQVELARLVDMAAQRLRLNIQYDAATLKGAVTLRLAQDIDDEELWALTNRVLASQGFTTIRAPGAEGYMVVRLADAAAAAPLPLVPGAGTEPARRPGFETVVVRARHRPGRELIEAVKPLLSKGGASITELGASGLIVLADLGPRLAEIQRVLAELDTAAELPVVEEIPARNLSAAALAALVSQVAAKQEAISGRKLIGEVLAAPAGGSVVLIAPATAAPAWRELLAEVDRREAVRTATYTPRAFAPQEVAELIEATVRPAAGGDERWRLVTDELTGTLIVSATASEHEQIEHVLARLEASAPGTRRPMRSFVVRNRGVGELLGVLNSLLGAGVLEADEGSGALAPATPQLAVPDIGRSDRVAAPASPGPPPPRAERPGPVTESSAPAPRPSVPRAGPTGGRDPGLVLTADEGTNTIIAVGDARQLAQLELLIQKLDVRQPQVLLEVLMVSLSESQSLSLGIELTKQLDLDGGARATLASIFGLASRNDALDPGGGAGAGFTGLVLNPGDFSAVLRALEILNDGRSSSVPRVLVGNNQQGTFSSVLQQPFATVSTGTSTTTTAFGGTLDAGTIATVRPQIAAGDHLILNYSVQLSAFVGASGGQGLPPPKQTNNIQSSVMIPDGHTVVVGGLELLREADAESRVPVIGAVPLLGELFKNRNSSVSRDRFFVFIRANVFRHGSFEDLKHVSRHDLGEAAVDEGWPRVAPRVIR
ncbi:MAG TPA: secretin N-terminal domain-containing protein [Phycisphaerales bacterium]|nr:secretin N-terminal domain-containing protein [Phycisphaerales bacterium]